MKEREDFWNTSEHLKDFSAYLDVHSQNVGHVKKRCGTGRVGEEQNIQGLS